MLTLAESQELIEKQISGIELVKNPEELYNPISYVLSIGGKRIRPALVLLACDLFSNSTNDAIMPAVAVEYFHNFTLLHDDVMDRADKRRGHPTVHKKWNENTAILSGDAMLIKAYQLVGHSKPALLGNLLKIFNQTALEVCEGQQYDMNFEDSVDVSIDEYLKMIELKTAVLIAASLKIGAYCGGASSMDADALYEFGRNIGMAFQLQDDLLDVYSDPKVFGKNIGGDIISNKKTYLLIKAIQKADKDTFKELNKWLTVKKFDRKEKINAVREVFDRLNVYDDCKMLIDEYFEKSLKHLENVNVTENKKDQLRVVADMLMKRDR